MGLKWAFLGPRNWTAPLSLSLLFARSRTAPALAWPRMAGLCLLGAAALLLGVLVYLTDRPALPAALSNLSPWLARLQLFGAAGQWLPSFVHPLAFSLFTVAALPARAAPRYGVCAAWCAVNWVFEVGQHAAIKASLAVGLQDLLGHSPLVRWLGRYFLRGTFDVADLMATLGGALAAAALLFLFHAEQEQHHAW